jgi:outer membrane receptor protein involved in Fe transport
MPSCIRTMVSSIALLAIASQANAGEWQHEIAPYVWGSAMDGTVGIGDVTAEADLSFSDIVDNLEFGFMGTYRASKDRYSITFDALYMGLGVTQEGRNGLLKGDIDVDQIGLAVDFGYALSERFTLLAGLRYTDLDTQIKASGPLGNTLSGEDQQSWVDPVIGAKYSWPLSDRWSATLRGDFGGFGVGSEFAMQGIATLRWQVSPRTGVLLAYRYLEMDYEDGSGDDFFMYDMTISGPAMGVVFTF